MAGICPGCNQSIHAESEVERLREALEWIRHQTGVATCDDAIRAMGEAYEAATVALGMAKHDHCQYCGSGRVSLNDEGYCADCDKRLEAESAA